MQDSLSNIPSFNSFVIQSFKSNIQFIQERILVDSHYVESTNFFRMCIPSHPITPIRAGPQNGPS